MNKLVLALSGLALAATVGSASAQSVGFSQTTVSGDVGVASRSDYRGQKYSDGASLGLGLKVSDLGLKGVYVDGNFNKMDNSFPLNSHPSQYRSDLGVGYKVDLASDWSLDLSAHHIYNADEHLIIRKDGKIVAGEYSEFRAKTQYSVFFAEVAQGMGQVQDTYASVGVNVPVTTKLHVGGSVSAYHYKNDVVTRHGNGNRYNDAEVFASYDLLKNVNVYGKYSFGGHAYEGRTLQNYGIVGVKYNF